MFDNKGNKLYAYITIAMQDIDISAALVLAYSLRQLNTQAELIVLTTDSINEKGIKLLQSWYDRIVNIKYAGVFTRYWGLALTEYKKVVLINANTIVLEQPDYIFSIDAPAKLKDNTDILLLEPYNINYEKLIKKAVKIDFNELEYLTKIYAKKWNIIGEKIYMYGLGHHILNSDMELSERTHDKNFILWHTLYEEIMKKTPELRKNNILQETNEIHKFYNKNNKIANASLIKDIPEAYTNIYYKPSKINIMFENIEAYDYFEPIRILRENTKSEYYRNIYNKKIEISDASLDEIISDTNIDIEDMDNIMLNYIKCRDNTNMLILWPLINDKNIINNIKKHLKSHGNVYYVREIILKHNGIHNLLYWIQTNKTHNERMKYIDDIMEYINVDKKNDNTINIILFDSNKKTDISEIIRKTDNKYKNTKDTELLYMNDYYYETIEYAKLLLNKNSIDALNNQRIIQNNDNLKIKQSHINFQILRKWIYNNLSQYDTENIILIGNIILYCYGMRAYDDIELITAKKMYLDFEKLGINKQNKQKLKYITKYFGIKNDKEICHDPRHHLYFQGMKCYLLEHEIIYKLHTLTDLDYADFAFMLNNKIYNKYVKKSKIPKVALKKLDDIEEKMLEYYNKCENIKILL